MSKLVEIEQSYNYKVHEFVWQDEYLGKKEARNFALCWEIK